MNLQEFLEEDTGDVTMVLIMEHPVEIPQRILTHTLDKETTICFGDEYVTGNIAMVAGESTEVSKWLTTLPQPVCVMVSEDEDWEQWFFRETTYH